MEATKVNPEAALSSPFNPAHYFAYASSAYLFLQSVPLLAFPRILLLLSTPRGAVGQATGDGQDGASAVSKLGPTLTPIEQFTSFAWGLAMITLALISIVQVSILNEISIETRQLLTYRPTITTPVPADWCCALDFASAP